MTGRPKAHRHQAQYVAEAEARVLAAMHGRNYAIIKRRGSSDFDTMPLAEYIDRELGPQPTGLLLVSVVKPGLGPYVPATRPGPRTGDKPPVLYE